MRPGALYWALHRISGVLLVIGMTIHFYVMHAGSTNALSHEAVLARLNNPGWTGFNLTLLGLVIYHGLYGLMGIVREYARTDRAIKHAKSALTSAGLLLMAYGIFILRP